VLGHPLHTARMRWRLKGHQSPSRLAWFTSAFSKLLTASLVISKVTSTLNTSVSILLTSELLAAVFCCWAVVWLGKVLRWKLVFLLLLSDVTKWGKCEFYVTLIKCKWKQGGHTNGYWCLCMAELKSGALILCMELVFRPCTCCVVCFGVLATVSGQQVVQCSCLTSPTEFS